MSAARMDMGKRRSTADDVLASSALKELDRPANGANGMNGVSSPTVGSVAGDGTKKKRFGKLRKALRMKG
jgi:hypothetical protein